MPSAKKAAPFVVVLMIILASTRCQDSQLDELFGQSGGEFAAIHQRTAAPHHAFPFYVSFKHRDTEEHFCAGTLISSQWILTSAWCMDLELHGMTARPTADVGIFEARSTWERDYDDLLPSSRLGTSLPQSHVKYSEVYSFFQQSECTPDLEMEIDDVVVPDGYSNGTAGGPPYNPKYDIALVKLSKPSTHVWAVLPFEAPNCCDGMNLLNIGMGRFRSDGRTEALLGMIAFPFMPYADCADAFQRSNDESFGRGTTNLTAAATICVDGEVADCYLDHGSVLLRYTGPLEPPMVVGFSNAATQCSDFAPYVFSNISFHMEWILSLEGVVESIMDSVGNVVCREDVIWKAAAEEKVLERRPACIRDIVIVDGAEYEETTCYSGVPHEEKGPPKQDSGLAKAGDYPYIANILTKNQKSHICQGALITERLVLTAASCVPRDKYEKTDIEVQIGGTELDPSENTTNVLDIEYHESIGSGSDEIDLAIIVLAEESTNKHIRLPDENYLCCRDNMTLQGLGWGATTTGGSFAPHLISARMYFLSNDRCKEHIEDLGEDYVCAENDDRGVAPCRGDEGSPLIMEGGAEDVLIGIVGSADVDRNCVGDKPTPFVSVISLSQWIKSHK